MIISNIICNRWVGHDFGDWRSKIDRVVCPIIVGGEACLFGSFYVGLLAMIAFPIWRYDGWGEQFLAMHGDHAHYAARNQDKWVTGVADWLYVPNGTTEQRKLYGVIWGGLRGLYDWPAFVILHYLLSGPLLWGCVPLIPLIGLLMGLQGVVYYLSGQLFPERGTPPAELIMGLHRGVLWTTAVMI